MTNKLTKAQEKRLHDELQKFVDDDNLLCEGVVEYHKRFKQHLANELSRQKKDMANKMRKMGRFTEYDAKVIEEL